MRPKQRPWYVTLLFAAGLGIVNGCHHTPPSSTSPSYAPLTAAALDVGSIFPKPAIARIGTEQVLTTAVFQRADRQPVSNQRVRYHLLDGPQASFLPNKTPEGIVVSDANGNASITLAQPVPRPGVSHIAVEILGPPDPAVPGDPGIVLGHAEATVEWQAPFVALSQTAPPTAAVGQDLTYTLTLTNTGQVETRYKKSAPTVQLFGETPGSFTARNWNLHEGRLLVDTDVESTRDVCVLGSSLATNLFPLGSPVGDRLKLSGINYTVVGVLELLNLGEGPPLRQQAAVPRGFPILRGGIPIAGSSIFCRALRPRS